MRSNMQNRYGRHRSCLLLSVAFALSYAFYIGQVVAMSVDTATNPWPVFPRRNLGSLARAGYLRGVNSGDKRSISTLAKNGQLPTFKSPYDETVKDDNEDDASTDKRNIASIARLRSYAAMKRNVQSLARDGYRFGRGQYQNDKRNIAALARDGMIHKRAEVVGDEYYYPFYQNPVPPLSEIEGPLDLNELYDYEQSINPNSLPPFSPLYKRSDIEVPPNAINSRFDYDSYWNLKRGSIGLPAHGLYRPVYIDLNSSARDKRSIYSIPDVLDRNDIDIPEDYDNDNDDKRSVDNDETTNLQKRHIGSLARLGLLPSFRFSGSRYSRSGRARLLLPSQELYRKHSPDENFRIREYFVNSEADASLNSDDANISPPSVSAHTHPTGRYLRQPLNNELPNIPFPSRPNNDNTVDKNRWQRSKEVPKFYYFRSLKVPYHSSGKRYLLQPTVDNILLRKTYRNSSLPSRRKNQ